MHAWVRQIEGVNFYRRGNQLVSWDLIVRSSPPSVLLVLCYFSHFTGKIQFNSIVTVMPLGALGGFICETWVMCEW